MWSLEWTNQKKITTEAATESVGCKIRYRRRKGLRVQTDEVEYAIKKKIESNKN